MIKLIDITNKNRPFNITTVKSMQFAIMLAKDLTASGIVKIKIIDTNTHKELIFN